MTVKEKDYKDYTLDELVEELYSYPMTSDEFYTIRRAIEENHLTDEKYNEYLFVVPSRMNSSYHAHPEKKTLDGFNNLRGIMTIPETVTPDDISRIPYFSDTLTFSEDKRFRMLKRNRMEYNPEFKQLVVSAYITDGRHVILLKTGTNGETRIQDRYTFIQGHVNFDKFAYLMPQKDFLTRSLGKELNEEIAIKKEGYAEFDLNSETSFISVMPKYYVNDSSNHIGLEHFGIIYELKVKDAWALFNEISTGEKSKHEVVLLDLREYKGYRNNLDNWVQLAFDKLIKE